MDIRLNDKETHFLLTTPSGTHVQIEKSLRGLGALWHVLAEDQRCRARGGKSRLGTDGSPLQHMIDSWMRDGKMIEKFNSQGKRTDITLEELGL